MVIEEHPQHIVIDSRGAPVHPPPLKFFAQWKREWACQNRGGHWWHPENMIDWFCCQCGAVREGIPKDGR